MIRSISVLLLLTLTLCSCHSSQHVSNNRLIQKRKYNKGFHFNFRTSPKSQNSPMALKEDKNYFSFSQDHLEKTNRKKPESEILSNNSTERIVTSKKVRERPSNKSNINKPCNDDYKMSIATSIDEKLSIFESNPTSPSRKLSAEEMSRKIKRLNIVTVSVFSALILSAAIIYLSSVPFTLLLIPLLLLIVTAIIYLFLRSKYRKVEVAQTDIETQKKVRRNNKLIWLTIGFAVVLFGFFFLSVLLFVLSGIIGILGVVGFVATIIGYIFLVKKLKRHQ